MATASESREELKRKAIEFAPFFHAFLECDDEVRSIVTEMIAIIEDDQSDDGEREMAADAMIEALHLGMAADIVDGYHAAMKSPEALEANAQLLREEASFAEKVRERMKATGMTQEELAEHVKVSQPAISNMLNRQCRPQRKTVARIAAALEVSPEELWPGFHDE